MLNNIFGHMASSIFILICNAKILQKEIVAVVLARFIDFDFLKIQ